MIANLPKIAELRRASEQWALEILTRVNLLLLFDLLCRYCVVNRIDPEVLALGLELLGVTDVVMNGGRLMSFALNREIHDIFGSRIPCLNMVYFKVWNPSRAILQGGKLLVNAAGQVYAGQTDNNIEREKSTSEKLKHFQQYFCIGHDINFFDLDCIEMALIFLIKLTSSTKNVSAYGKHHYTRVKQIKGKQGLVVCHVNNMQFSWTNTQFVGSAPPARIVNGPRYFDLEEAAKDSPALQLLLNVYGSAGSLIDHFPDCTSQKRVIKGLDEPNKIQKIETATNNMLLDATGQLILHHGKTPSTAGRIVGVTMEKYLSGWVGRARVVRVPGKKEKFTIILWAPNPGMVKYLVSAMSEAVLMELLNSLSFVATEFARFTDAFGTIVDGKKQLSLDQLEKFVELYEANPIFGKIISLGTKLSKFQANLEEYDVEEVWEDGLVMEIIAHHIRQLFPEEELFENRSNFQDLEGSLFGNQLYVQEAVKLNAALVIWPDFDKLDITGQRQVLSKADRLSTYRMLVGNLVNLIKIKNFNLLKDGVDDQGNPLSLDDLVNVASRGVYRRSYDKPKQGRSRCVFVHTGKTFVGAEQFPPGKSPTCKSEVLQHEKGFLGKRKFTKYWEYLVIGNDEVVEGKYPKESAYGLFYDCLVGLLNTSSDGLSYSHRDLYLMFHDFVKDRRNHYNIHVQQLSSILPDNGLDLARNRFDRTFFEQFYTFYKNLNVDKVKMTFTDYTLGDATKKTLAKPKLAQKAQVKKDIRTASSPRIIPVVANAAKYNSLSQSTITKGGGTTEAKYLGEIVITKHWIESSVQETLQPRVTPSLAYLVGKITWDQLKASLKEIAVEDSGQDSDGSDDEDSDGSEAEDSDEDSNGSEDEDSDEDSNGSEDEDLDQGLPDLDQAIASLRMDPVF